VHLLKIILFRKDGSKWHIEKEEVESLPRKVEEEEAEKA
jgi:uncharacterized protein (UPF0216 family)